MDLHAAREGDLILHPPLMAELISGLTEAVIYAAATAAVAAAIGGAVVAVVGTGGAATVLTPIIAGALVGAASMLPAGEEKSIGERVSDFSDWVGNSLFPAEPYGKISSGSHNTRINGIAAARAAGLHTGPSDATEAAAEEPSILETVGTYAMVGASLVLPVIGLAHAINNIFNPPVTTPAAPGTTPAPLEKAECSKHPPMPEQFVAQGSDKVFINGQPAARVGDKTTCDGPIGMTFSPNVRIGGGTMTVPHRDGHLVELYSYDPAGNLLDGHLVKGFVRHNRVKACQDKRYRYDRFGRLSEKRSASRSLQRFEYDAEHRLIRIHQQRGAISEHVEFSYDPLGRRTSKTLYRNGQRQPVSHTEFRWQGLRLLQEIQDGKPSLYLYTAPGSYEPLARIDGAPGQEALHYFHTNLVGLPEQLTDEQSISVWHSDFQVWGNSREEWHEPGQSRQQNLRFQGQYLDRETGLHYNTFRYFDPDTGSYTQSDPIGLPGGLNLYQYVANPLRWIDPLGLFGCDPKARKHILEGDSPTSGGHMWPGNPGKTVFPQSWNAKKIIAEVDDIVNSPTTKWYAQKGSGGAYTKNGDVANWVAWETRDGVRIRVVYQPAKGRIITAFPDNEPIPNLPGAK
ncbi:PAAR/RHS domain-containing protein [Pseudomonas sp. X10]